jgi:NAD(P)H-hydrate epimerase
VPVQLPIVQTDANKYSRGSLLVLAGSKRYFGAGVMAAQAATRAGAGYVTLATPGKEAAAAARMHLLSTPIFEAADQEGAFAADALDDILGTVKHHDAIVLGCGITLTDSTKEFAKRVVEQAAQQAIPLLLDADALSGQILTENRDFYKKNAPNWLKNPISVRLSDRNESESYRNQDFHLKNEIILTPHAGELNRLLEASGLTTAQELAIAIGGVVVAKGPETIITDAENTVALAQATPALAKAGTGDVLSGIIGSLLAQGMQPFAAAHAGVEIHSLAGRLAAEQNGVRSVIAEDVIAFISQAIQQLSAI